MIVNIKTFCQEVQHFKGGSSQKLKEGQPAGRAPKMPSKHARQGCEKILDSRFRKFFGVLRNNVLVCMFSLTF